MSFPLNQALGSPYGMPQYQNQSLGNSINQTMYNSGLGTLGYNGDNLSIGNGSLEFKPPQMPQVSQTPSAAANPSFAGRQDGAPSNRGIGGVVMDALGVAGAAGVGYHGTKHFYTPKLEGEALKDAYTAKKVADYSKVTAGLEQRGKLLDEIVAAGGDKSKLSTDAAKLSEYISKSKKLTVDGMKTKLASVAESMAKKVEGLKTVNVDDIATNKPLMQTLTKTAKSKVGMIGAAITGALALVYAAFRD